MKITVIKNNEKKINYLSDIILLLLGIILILDAKQLVTSVFIIIGILITIFGALKFYDYFKLKKQLNIESPNLINGIILITIGLITTLLASILSQAIQIVTGLIIISIGIQKLTDNNLTIQKIIQIAIYFGIGLYTIFAKNLVYMIIGIFLVITAIYDLLIKLKLTKN